MTNLDEKSYSNEKLTKQYENLIRKIDDTRRSRFHMATRLRAEHEWRSRLLLFYNIIIIILSIITLYQYFTDHVPMASYIILAFSISLSLYSTHLGGTSRMETAGVMNQNANALSSILSSVQFAQNEIYSTKEHLEKIRYYTKKYESTINNVENHSDIDYMYEKLKSINKKSSSVTVHTIDEPIYKNQNEQKPLKTNNDTDKEINTKNSIDDLYGNFTKKTKKYERREKRKCISGYVGGIIIALLILMYPLLAEILHNIPFVKDILKKS